MSSVLASVLPTTMTDALKTLEDFLVDPPVKVTDLQAYFDAVLHADSINDRYLVVCVLHRSVTPPTDGYPAGEIARAHGAS